MQTVPRTMLTDTSGDIADAVANLIASFRGHISGLTLSTAGASATFGVAAGVATDSTASALMTLGAAVTKTTAAWSVGSGGGSWDGGGVGPAVTSSWYHVYLIRRPDTGAVDVCVSQNPAAPTFGAGIPVAYTQFRRIGSLKTNVSFQWLKFVQTGDTFLWDVGVTDANITPGAGTLSTLTVPTGVTVEALLSASLTSTAVGDRAVIHSPLIANQSTANEIHMYLEVVNLTTCMQMRILTNTLAQVRSQATTTGTVGLILRTNGWVDRRGQD